MHLIAAKHPVAARFPLLPRERERPRYRLEVRLSHLPDFTGQPLKTPHRPPRHWCSSKELQAPCTSHPSRSQDRPGLQDCVQVPTITSPDMPRMRERLRRADWRLRSGCFDQHSMSNKNHYTLPIRFHTALRAGVVDVATFSWRGDSPAIVAAPATVPCLSCARTFRRHHAMRSLPLDRRFVDTQITLVLEFVLPPRVVGTSNSITGLEKGGGVSNSVSMLRPPA